MSSLSCWIFGTCSQSRCRQEFQVMPPDEADMAELLDFGELSPQPSRACIVVLYIWQASLSSLSAAWPRSSAESLHSPPSSIPQNQRLPKCLATPDCTRWFEYWVGYGHRRDPHRIGGADQDKSLFLERDTFNNTAAPTEALGQFYEKYVGKWPERQPNASLRHQMSTAFKLSI
jgi:hypothetical protein